VNCPYCGVCIEEALEIQYGISDKICCPDCKNISTILYEECFTEDDADIGYFYLSK
jgi:hypothetical protein